MLQLSLIDTVSFAYTFWLTLVNVGFLSVFVLLFVLSFGFWSGFSSGFGSGFGVGLFFTFIDILLPVGTNSFPFASLACPYYRAVCSSCSFCLKCKTSTAFSC